MICLCIPPLARGQDLRDDLTLPPLLVDELGNFTGNLLLLCVVVEDAGAVLRAGVWALAVRGCGVMHLVEEFEELAVGDLRRVICYL